MGNNPLKKIPSFGQSIWLDYLDRNLMQSGELNQLIEEDGLRGITSNPAIFDKAISGSEVYDKQILRLKAEGESIAGIYERITVEDVQLAADAFRRVYDESGGQHGFVSLEVNPHLARNTAGTIDEARRLWQAVDRPNIFIKVPATAEGLPAIEHLIGEGLNINVTLLFGLPRYGQVTRAYIAGLRQRQEQGHAPANVSVASFFLSRIDVLVDRLLAEMVQQGKADAEKAAALQGEIAIASARQAYQIYKEIFNGQDFANLKAWGARPQRVLWASTSTKNPQYSDIKYIEPLIGPETINTMPKKTLDAYRDHGHPASRVEEEVEEARRRHQQLAELGIDIDEVTRQLEEEGIEKFIKPYDQTMETLKEKTVAAREERS
jgi:transaldolase